MPRKTSISLSDEDDALLHEQLAAGVPLRDIIRRGLGVERPDVALAREAAQSAADAVREDIREMVRGVAAETVREMMRQSGGGGY